MDWKRTNYREQHLHIGKRIVGKLARKEGALLWTCMVKPKRGPYQWVGYRVREDRARAIVEKRLLVKE